MWPKTENIDSPGGREQGLSYTHATTRPHTGRTTRNRKACVLWVPSSAPPPLQAARILGEEKSSGSTVALALVVIV